MALTSQEMQIVQFGKQNGKSRDEIIAAISSFRGGRQEVAQPSRLAETGQDIVQTVSAIGGGFAETGKKIVDIAGEKDLSIGEKA